jgi:hypothetical protein
MTKTTQSSNLQALFAQWISLAGPSRTRQSTQTGGNKHLRDLQLGAIRHLLQALVFPVFFSLWKRRWDDLCLRSNLDSQHQGNPAFFSKGSQIEITWASSDYYHLQEEEGNGRTRMTRGLRMWFEKVTSHFRYIRKCPACSRLGRVVHCTK